MKEFLKKHKILIISTIAVILIGLGIFAVKYLTPEIKLIGNTPINLPVYEKYNEQGAKAWFGRYDISNNIDIDGQVNVTKLGTYELTYSVINLFFKANVVRIVNVIDITKPEITLTGGNEVNVCPHKKFVELGYKAVDNYDGDITNKVIVTVSENEAVYQVSDSSNNMASVVRKINRVDTVPPVIKLKGSAKVYLSVGSTYKESGYTVTDTFDTNIGKSVVITGTVNTKLAGTYVLTYLATDCSGNSAKVTRTVVVSNPTPSNGGGSGGGTAGSGSTIYLTFDDGPSYLTPQILDILKSEGVKATFFVIGNRENDATWRRTVAEGHTLALHCNNHTYSVVYASVGAYFTDLYTVRDKVKAATGVDSKIIRFPGGSSNTVSRNYSLGIMTTLVREVQARGFHYFDWNVGSGDTANLTSSQIYSNVIRSLGTKSTYVVLMHDYGGNETTRDALRSIIRYGKSHGYKFGRITMDTPQIHHNVAN